MPEISRFRGIIITMYYGDPARHSVPHFHARYGEYQASFTIDPVSWHDTSKPRYRVNADHLGLGGVAP